MRQKSLSPPPWGFSLLQTTSLQDSMASFMSSFTLPRGLSSQPVSTPRKRLGGALFILSQKPLWTH